MKNGILAILVGIVILAVIVVPAFILPFLQSAGVQSEGSQYLKECPVGYLPQSPGPNTTQLETLAAFTIQPGSAARICVEYHSESDSPVTASLNGSVYFESNMTTVPSSLIQVTAVPLPLTAPAQVTGPQSIAYAMFTLNVTSSARGFYMLSLPGICPLMPLAVGYSEIDYANFAYGWHHQNQCQNVPIFGSYVSVANVNSTYSYVPLQDQ